MAKLKAVKGGRKKLVKGKKIDRIKTRRVGPNDVVEGKAVWAGQFMIPSNSVLAPLVRRGAEGRCLACGKSIREHFGHRGAWLGCQSNNVATEAVFVLVPVAMPLERRQTRQPATQAAEMQTRESVPKTWAKAERIAAAKAAPVTKFSAARLMPRYVYVVKDKRTKTPDTFNPAMKDAYEGLKKALRPVNADEAAKLAKRPKEANRRSLNLLVEFGLVTRQDISQQESE